MKAQLLLPLACVLAVITVASAIFWGPVSAQEKDKGAQNPLKWEYKLVLTRSEPHLSVGEIEENLNKLGAEGWDCVATLNDVRGGGKGPTTTQGILICKRPKK